MNAADESSQRIDLPLHDAVRVVTGEAHLRVGAVAHQKILRNLVDALHMGTVATGALDIAVHQVDRAGGIGGLALRDERRHQVRSVFHRQHQAEGMGAGQSVPNESTLFIELRPSAIARRPPIVPTPTVPSWQLRHRLLVSPSVGWVFPCSL